jgi:hypothetical protein
LSIKKKTKSKMFEWWDKMKASLFGAVSDDDVMSTINNPDGSVTTTYRNGRKSTRFADGHVEETGGGSSAGAMFFIIIVLILFAVFGGNCRQVGERRGADGKMHPIWDCSKPKPQQQMMMMQPVAYAPAPMGYAPAPMGYAPAPMGYAPAAPMGYAPAPVAAAPVMRIGRR